MIGKTLAHYEITAKIGEGGMGEVYRAHDTKLDRDVALKILPRTLSGDRERSARFEREARTLASLQHANIASIYGYEQVDGVRFLAMELIEGEDLSERLARGALPIDEALRIAHQITVGLEAAHEKNIVHRDLKPANVKVDPEGVVKILDFGLARAYADDTEDGSNPNLSPTITAAMTQAGVILGTAAYMSPEQARGRRTDKRSDIWSFGVMLYEMLTGSQLYRGETVTDILGAIVHSAPDVEALPSNVPAAVKTLVARCLTPDLQDRLRDIGEARYILSHPHAPVTGEARKSPASPSRLWLVTSLVLFAVALALGGVLWFSGEPPANVIQASIALPSGHSLMTTGSRGGSLRVSPDGRSVAFVAQEGGQRQIWIRSLDQREGHPVQGTEGGHRPFWSPDSRSIGFFVDGNLRRVSVSGGAALTIAAAADGRGATWLASGLIVFAPTPGSALFVVPAGGGQARQITQPEPRAHREPRALPVDDSFLFLEDRGGGLWMICVGNVDGSAKIEVGLTGGGVEYADGYLLYLQGRTLVAQPFDIGSSLLTGEPTPVAEDVIRDSDFGIGVFSSSDQGVLCYQSGVRAGSQLMWMDRTGTEIGPQGERAEYSQYSLSDDGKTIAVIIADLAGNSDIWLIDVARDTRQRFTFTPDEAAKTRAEPHWSPDGSLVVYSVEGDSATALYSKRTDGGSDEQLLFRATGIRAWVYDISPDGEWVLFGREGTDSNEDLWVLPLSGEGETRAVLETPFDEWPAEFSPDGRWLAFDSDEAGRREIYVVRFPDGGGRWQISRNGGRYPHWNAEGTELYYIDPEGRMIAAPVDPTGDTFRSDEPLVLFQAGMDASSNSRFDVNGSGERFLIMEQAAQNNPISLYMNWKEALQVR